MKTLLLRSNFSILVQPVVPRGDSSVAFASHSAESFPVGFDMNNVQKVLKEHEICHTNRFYSSFQFFIN